MNIIILYSNIGSNFGEKLDFKHSITQNSIDLTEDEKQPFSNPFPTHSLSFCFVIICDFWKSPFAFILFTVQVYIFSIQVKCMWQIPKSTKTIKNNDAKKSFWIARIPVFICVPKRSHQISLSMPFLFDPSQKHTTNTYHTNQLAIYSMHV